MRQDDWTKQLRDRLADHEEAVPHGLWADIEHRLDAQAVPRRKWLIGQRLRLAAAAVAAVCLVGAGSWLLLRQEADTTRFTARQQRVPGSRPSVESAAEVAVPQSQSESAADEHLLVLGTSAARTTLPATDERTAVEDVGPEAGQSPAAPSEATATPPKPEYRPADATLPPAATADRAWPAGRTARSAHARLGLYASNSFSASGSMNGVRVHDPLLINYTGMMPAAHTSMMMAERRLSGQPLYLPDTKEESHHDQPLSLGLSAGYPLTERLALTSGVVYTRLHAEFTTTMRHNRIVREQTLHYVGVPLQLDYTVWKNKRLHTYVGAGGQADFHVGGKTEVDNVRQHTDRDRVQWSMGGMAGIEYKVVPQVGIYVEPGARYYIDNHSNMETFFKDKPLNFNLQVGVRVNVK